MVDEALRNPELGGLMDIPLGSSIEGSGGEMELSTI